MEDVLPTQALILMQSHDNASFKCPAVQSITTVIPSTTKPKTRVKTFVFGDSSKRKSPWTKMLARKKR
jgi:hypothetical protein